MLENPEIWINGGLASVSILLILLVGFTFRLFYKFATNHVSHSDKIHKDNAKVSGRLIEVIKMNNKVLERMERKLDKNGFK